MLSHLCVRRETFHGEKGPDEADQCPRSTKSGHKPTSLKTRFDPDKSFKRKTSRSEICPFKVSISLNKSCSLISQFS